MKVFKKLMAGVSALALSFSLAASGMGTALPAVAADDTNDDWLHAVGSRLYDSQGNEVWLTGANWFGFNCSENCLHGLNTSNNAEDMLAAIAERGINVLRFPISTTLLKSWMDGKPHKVSSVQAAFNPPVDQIGEDGTVTPAGAYDDVNRDFVLEDGTTLKNSMEIFDVIIQKCKKQGIKVFIDIHSPDENNSGHSYELWYGKAGITTKDWQDSLVWLAEKYANDDTIIGYDLKNEPHGKRMYSGEKCPTTIAKWDDSTDENNWAYAATQCAEAILDVNPNALIFIEGIEQYPMTEKGYTFDTPDVWEPQTEEDKRWYGAWWGGNLRGVKDYPIKMSTPEKQSKIVYSPHDYGPSVYPQTWFAKEFTTETLLDDYWRDTWAYINEQDIAPLLIGEWGGFVDGTKNEQWMRLLQQYMINNHINHTYWCINPNSGDTGGLLGYDFMTWDEARYEILEKALWQTKTSGKFIGLDHQIPLGGEGSTTGITVTDYYATYAKSEGSNLDAGGETKPQNPEVTPTQPATEQVTEPATDKPADKPTDAPDKGLCGDVDESGKVDIIDVIALEKNLMTGEKLSAQGKKNAVTTGAQNRDPDAVDALNILKYVVEIYPSLPV
ncbi:MAG: cellulase family glycosylhydrolase [Oscillospiraceae bacterium]|nr:cellulase family glycosylhydrolase [Oscillospiraceae bacterium]